jgi:hypothetical protein
MDDVKRYTCTVIAIRSKQRAGLRPAKLICIVTAWKLTDPTCGSTATCTPENSEVQSFGLDLTAGSYQGVGLPGWIEG